MLYKDNLDGQKMDQVARARAAREEANRQEQANLAYRQMQDDRRLQQEFARKQNLTDGQKSRVRESLDEVTRIRDDKKKLEQMEKNTIKQQHMLENQSL